MKHILTALLFTFALFIGCSENNPVTNTPKTETVTCDTFRIHITYWITQFDERQINSPLNYLTYQNDTLKVPDAVGNVVSIPKDHITNIFIAIP